MRMPMLIGLLIILAVPAWADRLIDMGSPQLTGVFMGPHAADCVDQPKAVRTDTFVAACFDQNIDSIMQAWQRALQRNRTQGGQIKLRLHIAASGVVQAVSIESSGPLLDQPFQQELLTIVKVINFHKAASDADMTHILNFVPR